ncbi:MAG: hypothetical protein P8O87_04435 [Crocinitomicaceae bacterium]|jgi:hypothetical protein|nr:hypothetical protein [Crocinitomicaceae bacterium]
MKWSFFLVLLSFGLTVHAQKSLNPRNSKKMFGGPQSFQDYNLFGLQFQLGGATFLNRTENPTMDIYSNTDALNGNYTIDPKNRLGFYGEVGMFHFPKKFPKLKISQKKSIVLLSYVDWGVGFKYFSGNEQIEVNYMNPPGGAAATESRSYSFTNGNVYGRFSMHKNNYFQSKKRKEKLNFFLDHSIGFNFEYRLVQTSSNYDWPPMTTNEQYSKPFQFQMHYGLGFGFSPKRGTFIVPGIRLPILGYQSTQPTINGNEDGISSFGKPSMHWFSSRHWPLLVNVKFMFAFPKKASGCATGITNEQDKKTEQGR